MLWLTLEFLTIPEKRDDLGCSAGALTMRLARE
jgi:hypothetical protein